MFLVVFQVYWDMRVSMLIFIDTKGIIYFFGIDSIFFILNKFLGISELVYDYSF